MARYYGEITGNGKPVSRQGTEASRIRAHIRGWDFGVKVWIIPDPKNPTQDIICVGLTGGSNDPGVQTDLGTFTIADLEKR